MHSANVQANFGTLKGSTNLTRDFDQISVNSDGQEIILSPTPDLMEHLKGDPSSADAEKLLNLTKGFMILSQKNNQEVMSILDE